MSNSLDERVETSLSKQDQRVLDEVVRTLRGVRYGSLVLTVHDGRVVEIHRTEKIRISGPRTTD